MEALLDALLVEGLHLTALLGLLLKGTFICVIATAINLELSLMPAIVRHRVALGAIASLALLPVASWSLSSWELPVLPRSAGDNEMAGWRYGSLLVITYLIIASVLLLRLARDILVASRLCRRAERADRLLLHGLDPELRDVVGEVKVSSEIQTPLTLGALAPTILLPQGSARWSDADLAMVLQHELGHIDRGDWIKHLLARFVASLYWPVPGMRLLQRQLSLSAEQACDDRVLAAGASAPEYAAMLLRQARGNFIPASVSLGHGSELGLRIRYMVEEISDHSVSASGATAMFIASAALTIPLATLQLVHRPQLPVPPWGIDTGEHTLPGATIEHGGIRFDTSVLSALEPGPQRPPKPARVEQPPDSLWRYEKPTIPPP